MKRDPPPLKLPALDDWTIEPAAKEEVARFDTPLKVLPKNGVMLWWPADGESNLHPDDVEVGKSIVPSTRVLTKTDCVDEEDTKAGYVNMAYGDVSFRIKPVLWLEIESDGFLLGDQVEIRSKFGKNQPMVVELGDMFWNRKEKRIEYHVVRFGTPVPKMFLREDFKFSARIGQSLNARELMLQARDQSSSW